MNYPNFLYIQKNSIIISKQNIMTDKSLVENYLNQKVNPLFEQLLIQIIKNRPKNILNYCRTWMQKKYDANNMMVEQSDSDEQEQEHHLSQLMERKGQNRWYEKRKGICGEVYGSHHLWLQSQIPVVNKKSIVNSRILFRLKSLFLFKDFDDGDINRLILAMTEHLYQQKSYIIKQGQLGNDMFIIDSGELECIKDSCGQNSVVKVIKQGEMFGQNSMLYNTPRWASIRAKTNCILFRLDRKTYHSIVNQRNLRKRKIFQNSIQKCQFLKQLQTQQKYKLQDLIEEIPIHQNQYIIRQGKINKKIYIIQSGKFVSLKRQKNGHDQIINQFKEGDLFGEIGLISKKPSKESVMSLTNGKIYGLQYSGIERVLGSITKILKRSLQIYQKYKNYDNS